MPRIAYSLPMGYTAEQMYERRGGVLTPLDLLLAHNDGLAQGWNSLLGAVRSKFALPSDVREMAILRIAVLNRAPYEWDAHLPVARGEGLEEEIIRKLGEDEPELANPIHDAVLKYTDAMTQSVFVSDTNFGTLRSHFDDTSIAELTATIAAYNMVSRFLVALDVRTEDRHARGLNSLAPTPVAGGADLESK